VEFFYFYFLCHQELFGLQATLEFKYIKFEPTHPPIGTNLRKVLTSMRSALYKPVSRSIPIVTAQVGYLGSEVFDLIPHSPELILLVLPPFSVRFAFRLRKSQSWLATTTVQPTTHVLQANCQLLLTCLVRMVAPPHSWKVIEF
jgi:hypothetical protein